MRDLSLKFGILPERVKAILWQREYFWREVYPKIGETGVRLGLALEFTYTMHHPFIDYGLDLNWMAAREWGVEMRRIKRGLIDKAPTKHTISHWEEWF